MRGFDGRGFVRAILTG